MSTRYIAAAVAEQLRGVLVDYDSKITATYGVRPRTREFMQGLLRRLSTFVAVKDDVKGTVTIHHEVSKDLWATALINNAPLGDPKKSADAMGDYTLLHSGTDSFMVHSFLVHRHPLLKKKVVGGPQVWIGCTTKVMLVAAESLYDTRPNHGKVDKEWLDSHGLTAVELVELADLSYRFGLIRLNRTVRGKLFNNVLDLNDKMVVTCSALKTLRSEQKGQTRKMVDKLIADAISNASRYFIDLGATADLCWDSSDVRREAKFKLPKRELCKVHIDYLHPKLAYYDAKQVFSNGDYCCSTGPRIPIPTKFVEKFKVNKWKKIKAYAAMVALLGEELLDCHATMSHKDFVFDKGIVTRFK